MGACASVPIAVHDAPPAGAGGAAAGARGTPVIGPGGAPLPASGGCGKLPGGAPAAGARARSDEVLRVVHQVGGGGPQAFGILVGRRGRVAASAHDGGPPVQHTHTHTYTDRQTHAHRQHTQLQSRALRSTRCRRRWCWRAAAAPFSRCPTRRPRWRPACRPTRSGAARRARVPGRRVPREHLPCGGAAAAVGVQAHATCRGALLGPLAPAAGERCPTLAAPSPPQRVGVCRRRRGAAGGLGAAGRSPAAPDARAWRRCGGDGGQRAQHGAGVPGRCVKGAGQIRRTGTPLAAAHAGWRLGPSPTRDTPSLRPGAMVAPQARPLAALHPPHAPVPLPPQRAGPSPAPRPSRCAPRASTRPSGPP
jgi:hypothetical protein